MKKKAKKGTASRKVKPPSRLIDARIKELGDWRGETLSRVRSLIEQADPAVVEEWKRCRDAERRLKGHPHPPILAAPHSSG